MSPRLRSGLTDSLKIGRHEALDRGWLRWAVSWEIQVSLVNRRPTTSQWRLAYQLTQLHHKAAYRHYQWKGWLLGPSA